MTARTKPKVELVGRDGNAFAILGRCHQAAKKAGWTKQEWDAFHAEATSGDYDHLLQTVIGSFEDVGHERYDPDEDDE